MSYEITDGYADFYLTKTRRARIAHQCHACDLAIEPGQRYQESRIGYEGTIDRVKRCGRCEITYRHLRSLCDGFTAIDERLDCGLGYAEEWGLEPPAQIRAAVFATAEEASGLLS